MTRTGYLIAAGVAGLAAATPACAAHWNVDHSKSKVGFTVNWGRDQFSGIFRSWQAEIDFDSADLAHSHADVSIDIGSETSGDAETDDSIKGAEGFATSKFPTATFKATRFTQKSGNSYLAEGMLSIKGISRPVTIPFTLTVSGPRGHVTGKAQILRTDFNVGMGEWAKADPVAREVTVNIDLIATKSGS